MTAATGQHPILTDRSVLLISCVKTKRSEPSRACDLYTSAWFQKARSFAEERHARWFILSALYGLVPPDRIIEPYDWTLKDASAVERRTWAAGVLKDLEAVAGEADHIVFFAGERYRDFLADELVRRGFRVDVPMEHLRQGQQLRWLASQL